MDLVLTSTFSPGQSFATISIPAGFANIETNEFPAQSFSTAASSIAMGDSKSSTSTSSQEGTLYDRLGGDAFINILTCSFFDEIVENRDLKPFFKHISVAALKTHQVKLFRVIFGKDEEKPEEEDLLDFMLKTHTRLFRELGLDETHFDQVAGCFVQGLQSFQIGQGLIDECVAILVPLRVVFEYGAQVAAKEKDMDAAQLATLPKACAKMMGTPAPAVLPEYSKIEIPDWLPKALRKCSRTSNVRAWTCDLTDRFGAEGDVAIADTFLDQPYMDHHVYLVAFLELAFFPDHIENKQRQKLLKMIQYPRGRKSHRLSRALFDRMIDQFLLTCHAMGVQSHATGALEAKLRTHRQVFSMKSYKVGGVNAPHILRKVVDDQPANKKKKAPVVSKLAFDDDSRSITSKSSKGSYFSHESSQSGSVSPSKTKKSGSSAWSWLRSMRGKKTVDLKSVIVVSASS